MWTHELEYNWLLFLLAHIEYQRLGGSFTFISALRTFFVLPLESLLSICARNIVINSYNYICAFNIYVCSTTVL